MYILRHTVRHILRETDRYGEVDTKTYTNRHTLREVVQGGGGGGGGVRGSPTDRGGGSECFDQ